MEVKMATVLAIFKLGTRNCCWCSSGRGQRSEDQGTEWYKLQSKGRRIHDLTLAGRTLVAFCSAQVLGLCDAHPSWGGHSALLTSSGPLLTSPRKVRHLPDMPPNTD